MVNLGAFYPSTSYSQMDLSSDISHLSLSFTYARSLSLSFTYTLALTPAAPLPLNGITSGHNEWLRVRPSLMDPAIPSQLLEQT